MKQNRGWIVACTALLCVLCAGLAYGASNGEKVKISGLITGRDGENLIVKNSKTQTNVTVVLTDTTKVQIPKGIFKLRHSEQAETALLPGLQVSVEGIGDASRVTAKSIEFSKDDLRLAETIQAGLNPTAQQVSTNQQDIAGNKGDIATNQKDIATNQVQTAANRQDITASQGAIAANQKDIAATTQRFNDLSEYDTKGTATVHFAVGKDAISADDQAALTTLAQGAVSLTGYIIQVKGYADSTGSAAMNQQLSMDRAQAVVAYLLQNCHVPLRHIVAPGAMGEADPSAPNETADGRAENRRVDVKVLVNRGVAGGA
jgi:OOP family OmpA-OmpF porin